MNVKLLATDDYGYPSIEWPDTASHLLFDIGFSYGMILECETILKGLRNALEGHESERSEANLILKERLDDLIGRIENFQRQRLNVRDELYDAGQVAAAKLESK